MGLLTRLYELLLRGSMRNKFIVVKPRAFCFGLGSVVMFPQGIYQGRRSLRTIARGLWLGVNQMGECGLSSLQRRTAQQETVKRMAMI